MNARERIQAVLNGKTPDRVPISTYELVGYNSNAWENNHPTYARLMDVFPYVTEMVDLIHSKGAKVCIHCHGKIAHVLDMILETGVDGIDPCEAPPDGDIDLTEVKKQVDGKICIFGNLQLKLLEGGTPEQVEHVVKDCLAAVKTGGGYVIMPTAAPIDTPLSPKTEKNYFHFIEAALEYESY